MLKSVAQLLVGGDDVEEVAIGGQQELALIAGPCVIESEHSAMNICGALRAICGSIGIPLIFKASFDKANRTSLHSYRGPGMAEGLRILARIRNRFGVPITTDVHLPEQVDMVAQTVDLLQVPAFLCRQTDLLVACARSGKPVNVKKGQFLSPHEVGAMVAKLALSGAQGVMVTERGSSFGYQNLVVDMRTLMTIRNLGIPACFDATHSVQQPGAHTDRSGGDRRFVPILARAATAAGIDALFMEVHDDPESALSDGDNMVPLAELPPLLRSLQAIDQLVRSPED